MSIFIKPSVFKARDDEDEFRGVDVLAETSVQGYLEAIEEKGEETIDSIPDDYTSLVNEVADVKGDIIYGVMPYNCVDLLFLSNVMANGTHKGITYAFSGASCTVSGTSTTSKSFRNVYANKTALPAGIVAGNKYNFNYTTPDTNVRLAVIFYDSDGSEITPNNYLTSSRTITVPSNAVGMVARIDIPSDKTVNATVSFSVVSTLSNSELVDYIETESDNLTSEINKRIYAKNPTPYVVDSSLALSSILEDGYYVISDNWTVTDAPTGLTVTGLTVERFSTYNQSGFVKQIVEDLIHPTTTKRYYRFSNNSGSAWSEWIELGGDNHTNEYVFNEYQQTVELSASPQITADTNNYLAPTGDTTDRTADIIAMLTSSKVCRLGTGDYYINGLQMPDNSAIIGSGSGTKIHLSGTADGYAIKPGSYCTLSDFTLMGSSSGLTFGDTIGGRHGILWQGNYTENRAAPFMCIMSNLYIRDFSGGGITCYDTGYGTLNAIEATNIVILGCWAGLNISYWSEFHKFTNVRCYSCRVGCVNNGGNNIFVNCDFSSSKEIGMLMDNSQSQSPNNSHGSCIGCVFNHTGSGGTANSGVGIKMLNCDNGFIFSGCQIFFSKIDVEDSDGVVFSDCNIGKDNCNIIVNGGGVVLFTGNMHQGVPSSGTWISVSNNQNVHFVNCYVKSTGASVQPT